MPIYEYCCQSCGHQLEVLQKMTDEPLVECPNCHKAALSKLVSAASFQLKGTGWYATDFRDKGKPKPKSTGEEGGSEKTSSQETGAADSSKGESQSSSSGTGTES